MAFHNFELVGFVMKIRQSDHNRLVLEQSMRWETLFLLVVITVIPIGMWNMDLSQSIGKAALLAAIWGGIVLAFLFGLTRTVAIFDRTTQTVRIRRRTPMRRSEVVYPLSDISTVSVDSDIDHWADEEHDHRIVIHLKGVAKPVPISQYVISASRESTRNAASAKVARDWLTR